MECRSNNFRDFSIKIRYETSKWQANKNQLINGSKYHFNIISSVFYSVFSHKQH